MRAILRQIFHYNFLITELGIALLEGGNQDIQQTLFTALHSGDTSQNFFKVFHEKMSEAQMEIKSSVTVNTSDIAAKANEEKDLSNKELDKALKKRNAKPANGVILTEHLKEELDDALTSTQQVIIHGRFCTLDGVLFHAKVEFYVAKNDEFQLFVYISIMKFSC